MDQRSVDMFIITNQKYFPAEKIVFLKKKLNDADDEKFALVSTMKLKDPTAVLVVSFFFGYLGIDRFMIGEVSMGILKLLTFGFFGILTIVDWFRIFKKTKEYNYNKIMLIL